MNTVDPIVRDLEIMADAVNYRRWIYSQFEHSIGNRIIEVGAGIGTFTELFLDRELVVAVDSHEPCIEYLKTRFSGRRNIIPMKMDISDSAMAGLASYRPDTIVCINVLEHVRDDEAALSSLFAILQKGGHLALLVPAHGFLYGSIDRLVGHQRRYGKKDLRLKLGRAGFIVKGLYHMNSLSVPGWFFNNRILKRKEESPAQVLFFDRYVVPWLKIAEKLIRPPMGLSLVAIGEKGKGDRFHA